MKCNEGHEMQERTGNAEFELADGVSVTLKDARVFRCKECGVESPVVPAPAALVRAAAEAMARALACAGELDQAAAWYARASAAGAAIADDEDREIFTGDLATGPWFGLRGA